MGFIGIYRAIYDYTPSGEGELEIKDEDLLLILEKGEDDWWKAKRRAGSEEEDEPEGIIPANYVEKVNPIGTAKALYDYDRQTDEELSFVDEAILEVYDTSDPDWTLVGLKGDYGFVPANYIELTKGSAIPSRLQTAQKQATSYDPPTPSSSPSPVVNSAATLAGIIQQRTGGGGGGGTIAATRRAVSPPPAMALPSRRPQFTPEESDEEAPAPRLPQRPPSETATPPVRSVKFQEPASPIESPVATAISHRRVSIRDSEDGGLPSPGGYHMYNIYEMVEVLGKSKKMPVTLGINVGKGIIMISAEKESSSKEWTADKLTHYSIEGKHVFMELVRPSRSIDFHAGAKDTAQEIVSALGELAGAVRAEGLKEVFAAGSGGPTMKKGKVLYDFMAQGDDEVTVAEGDEVLILDDAKSEDWWMVRRIKNSKEGVVPSNYVDIIGTVPAPAPASTVGMNVGRSFVEQNRVEEARLAKQAAKQSRAPEFIIPQPEVGPGLQLPKRHSSLLSITDESKRTSSQRGKRGSRDTKADKKSLPNSSRVRTWTDRSGSFKVEAEFLGLRDEKIHLHKLNGVKIAVPVPKMSAEDLEYVEKATGVSLDELKPLSDIKRRNSRRPAPTAGAQVQRKSGQDWFDFFLQAGVDPQICERYSQAFNRDNIGEENLEDVTPQLLRTLGFKEGDILRVMKTLDAKFNRKRQNGEAESSNGSLFSGPGGALKNNTTKGRPVPPVETKNELDLDLLRPSMNGEEKKASASTQGSGNIISGFEDDAWAPRASKTAASSSPPPAQPASIPSTSQPPALSANLAELSLLAPPLQPTPAQPPQPQQQQQQQQTLATPQPVQPTGASPSLFEQLANAPPSQPKQRPNQSSQIPAVHSLIAPPPGRSASAPQNPNQASAFQPPPLQPQLTGYQPQVRMQTAAAPPGQSLADLNQQRVYQQQTGFMQAQPTGFQGNAGFNQYQPSSLVPQPTGYGFAQQNHFTGYGGFQPQQQNGFQNPAGQQPLMNGQVNGSPFADPPRAPFQPLPTAFPPQAYPPLPLQPQQTGINAFLPPALQPQATGVPANTFLSQSFSQPPMPPMPPIPPQQLQQQQQQQQVLAPLIPQKTGPAPPVRFGVGPAKRLVSQPTGRADLSKATAQNPFGF